MRDDRGSIQVVEAVMVAILILTGMIFFTITTRPSPEPGQTGFELGALAQDGLEYLETSNLIDPDNPDQSLTLEQWVTEIVSGTPRGGRVADAVDAQLDLVLPEGVQGALLLSNGRGRHILVPEMTSQALSQRAGGVGLSVVLPDWTANGDSAALQRALGDAYDWSTFNCLVAPTGYSTGPQQEAWIDIWLADDPDRDEIPRRALFGVWRAHTSAACNDATPTELQVVRPDGTATPLPAYALELVVWAGV